MLATKNAKLKQKLKEKDLALHAYTSGNKPIKVKKTIRKNPQFAIREKARIAKAKQTIVNNKKIVKLKKQLITAQSGYNNAKENYRNARIAKFKSEKITYRRNMNKYKKIIRSAKADIGNLEFQNSRSY